MEPRGFVAVADASPLIALHALESIAILGRLFERVVVPLAVLDELRALPGAPEPAALSQLSFIEIDGADHAVPPAAAGLDAGERGAIATAVARRLDFILLDEKAGRLVAAQLGLKVVGTIGVLVEAKRHAWISSVRECINVLRARNFWLAEDLVQVALAAAGEANES